MLPRLVLFSFLIFVVWLIRRDTVMRGGVSPSVWIPTLWLGILVSRPLSAWFGVSGIRSDVESATAGNPIDMLGFMGLIAAAMIVLSKRQLNWGELIQRNWPIFLFYGYLLLSVVWANNPFVSFKRWFKEFGNILVALVILTEANPVQALRVVFVRCAYVLIPLSEIFIRYFPDLGRVYNIHSGEMMAVGVTFQKNSLGAMVLVCSLILLWDFFQLWQEGHRKKLASQRFDYLVRVIVLVLGVYLLKLCDSKTSMLCLVLSMGILFASRSRLLRRRLSLMATLGVLGILAFLILDQIFGIKEALVSSLGRDMTFTGRTEVWEILLNVGTNPIIGTGFCSFWDDLKFQSQLPYFVAFSAHNGYLEIYLAGGMVGICLLALMLLATWWRIHKALGQGGDFAVLRFAVLVTVLIANFSESNFAVMSPVGFLFLIAALAIPIPVPSPQPLVMPRAEPRDAPAGLGAVHQLAWSPV
jgi:exopolysaccharide production protein ExoQ